MARSIEELRAYQCAYHAAHREKKIAYLRVYRETHKAEQKVRDAAYHVTHKEQRHAQNKAWKVQNPDKLKLLRRKYRAKHRERLNKERAAQYKINYATIKQHAAAYYVKNREEILQKIATWRLQNPEKVAAIGRRHKARKATAPINDFTAAQWQAMKEHYGHKCVYCERVMERLEQDHIIPLSKGGSHTLLNIVPACRSCNARKSAGPPLKPVQPLLL